MNKAFKFSIYPNSEQRELIAKTFGCVRFVYNKMLEEKISYYQETGQALKTTPAKYKTEYEFLKEVDSLALCNGQINLETAYKNFFRGKSVGFPKFKSKRNDRKSYTTNCVNNNIRIEDGFIVLPKLGAVKVKQHRAIPENYCLKSVTISQNASGKYCASILYAYEIPIQAKPIETVVGLDYSMPELYITDSGRRAVYPQYYRRALDRLRRMQRTLSKMTRYSKNYYKQKRKLAILHEHIANQRQDFQHKQSRQIANAYDCVAIEDLNMKAMQQALRFAKSVTDNAWGQFVTFLQYKLAEQGRRLSRLTSGFRLARPVPYAVRKRTSCCFRNAFMPVTAAMCWTVT